MTLEEYAAKVAEVRQLQMAIYDLTPGREVVMSRLHSAIESEIELDALTAAILAPPVPTPQNPEDPNDIGPDFA